MRLLNPQSAAVSALGVSACVITLCTRLAVLHLVLRKLGSKVNSADILNKASTPPDVFSDLRRHIMGQWATDTPETLVCVLGGGECARCNLGAIPL